MELGVNKGVSWVLQESEFTRFHFDFTSAHRARLDHVPYPLWDLGCFHGMGVPASQVKKLREQFRTLNVRQAGRQRTTLEAKKHLLMFHRTETRWTHISRRIFASVSFCTTFSPIVMTSLLLVP